MTPAPPCKTIAYAVRNLGASLVVLSAGVFNESAVNKTSAESPKQQLYWQLCRRRFGKLSSGSEAAFVLNVARCCGCI